VAGATTTIESLERNMSWVRSHVRFAVFAAVVALQALVLMGATAREEYYRHTGEEILVRTIPVDPFDLLRGQYVILGFGFQNPPGWFEYFYDEGDSVYVVLTRKGRYWLRDGYEASVPSRSSRDADTVYLKGRVASSSAFPRVAFPDLSRFYVREGTRPPRKLPDVVLSVRGDGTARIIRLEIDGRPWP